MKLPQRPPHLPELVRRHFTDPAWSDLYLQWSGDLSVDERYLHWDELRHRTPPDGLTLEQWWLVARLQRHTRARTVPLNDSLGTPFSYGLIDSLLKDLRFVDSSTSGQIQLPVQVATPETKRRYIVNSLINEAITSSQLEGASTTREVAKEMIRQGRPPRDRSERMILNNFQTMQRISELRNEALSKDLILEIHGQVTRDTLDNPTGAGRLRRVDENIHVVSADEEILHTPPHASQLEERIEQLCAFANDAGDTPFHHPFIRSMILHFWLVYDHPFIDGNGRTARALFYWSMLKHGYWLFEFISISEVILRSPAQYGRAFLHVETDGNDLTYFLLYHSKITQTAISRLRDYLKEKAEETNRLQSELRAVESLNHRQRALISHAIRHPGFSYTFESHRLSHQISLQTARTDLLGLEKRKWLRKRKSGRALQFTPVPDLAAKLREPLP